MSYVPSGIQYELRFGDHRAVIVEVGGGVREYRVGDRHVLDPYAADAMCEGASGAPLIPWPNRLGDGRYTFEGRDYQVPLTEPQKNNALHGFLRWQSWTPAERADDRVVMGTRLHAQQGYPFALDVQVDYRLGADGLTVTTTATNVGDTACPYASGHHPYLSPGSGLIDDATLQIDGASRVVTDEARQLPIATEAVAGTVYDFRAPRALGSLAIDYAYGDLERDADGRAWVRLTGTDGATASLWVDAAYHFLEIFTADTLGPTRRRTGVGTEPMTAPPNAFQSGELVIRLQPGESTTSTWGALLD